jgi:PAS domain S-box-containing protein
MKYLSILMIIFFLLIAITLIWFSFTSVRPLTVSGRKLLRWIAAGLTAIAIGLAGESFQQVMGITVWHAGKIAQYAGIFTLIISILRYLTTEKIGKDRTRELDHLNEQLKLEIAERKSTEAALKESEARYKELFEHSGSGIIIINHDGKYLLVNNKAAQQFGMPPEDIVGKSMFDLLPHDTAKKYLEWNRVLINSGGSREYEDSFLIQGKHKTFLIVDQLLNHSAGFNNAIQSSSIDISYRKNAEMELKESEEKYRVLFNNEIYAICIFDLETLILLDVNEAFIEMYGYDRDDLISKMRILDFSAEENGTTTSINQATELGSLFTPLRYHKKKDGTVFPVEIVGGAYEWNGRKVMFGIIHDITQRKRAEELLQEYAERLKLTMNTANIAWWEMDLSTGNVIFDKRKTDMIGYDSENFSHYKDFMALVHPEDYENTMNAMKGYYAGLFDRYEAEYRILTKSGEYKWFYDIGSITKKSRDGKPVKVAGIVIDITERKYAEANIRTLLIEKELILREVHHRIKNNMSTIETLLYLQAETLKDPQTITALKDAESRVQSMMVLYDMLYKSSNTNELLVSDYLSVLVAYISDIFDIGESIHIESRVDEFILDAETLSILGIIINELLTNIMKHAFTGRKNGSIMISASGKDGNVIFVIQDNGNGMPESVDFKTSTSFGLRLVWKLVQQMEGLIRIERINGTKIILEFHAGH